MTSSLSVITWYFPIDSGPTRPLTNEVLKLALDRETVAGGGGVSATYITTPDAELLAHPAKYPKIRYWWSLLVGPGQPIVPELGWNEIFGRLQDNPNFPIYKWRMRVPE